MKSGSGSIGAWVSGAVGLVLLLAWPTAWLLGKTASNDGAGIANVLALPLSLLGLVATVVSVVVGLRSQPQVDDPAVLGSAARELLRAVAKDEATALQQLLGDSGDVCPADVGFIQPEAGVRWRSDRGAASGGLTEVARYYRTLTRGRLVVLGEPGAGKTVLALRLLLDLATSARAALTGNSAAHIQVPIRLPLSSFIVPEHPHKPADPREHLETWIAENVAGYLNGNRSGRLAIARALVADGWVLPILDGLDEMDTVGTPPDRARGVLVALNQPSGASPTPPLVLTCRRDSYRHLSQHAPDEPDQRGNAGRWVQDATAIVLQPLESRQITAWLTHRFPDPAQANKRQARWQRVASTIERRPSGRLAQCLSSPLRLYLACAVYADPDSSPTQLCGLSSGKLDRHLLSHLVPAIARHRPRPDGTHYNPDNVSRWLATLAHHLTTMAHHGYPGTDIYLDHLWTTVDNPRRIRLQATVLSTIPLVLLIVTLVRLPPPEPSLALFDSSRGTVVTYLVAGLLLLYAIPRLDRVALHHVPRRLNLAALRNPRRMASMALAGLATGTALALTVLVFGQAARLDVVFATALAGGVEGGLLYAFTIGLTSAQAAIRHPSEPLKQTIGGVFIVGLGGAIAGLASSIILYGATWQGLALAVVFALTLAPTGFDSVPVLPRYLLATRALYRTDQLPRRPARFLDWAHDAGLIRLAGAAIQFRHQDLQAHFQDDHAPARSPGG